MGYLQVTSRLDSTRLDSFLLTWTYGYNIPKVPYPEWSDKLRAYVGDDTKEEHALLPLFHLVTGNLPADSVAPELDDSNAAAVLKASGAIEEDPLAAGAVTTDAIGMYLAYLVAIEFLPPPPAAGQRALPKCEIAAERLAALTGSGRGVKAT
ncbi:L-2-aminoadipate reductase large subunit like protein [Verticillium longisporum]|nr:L-2-aminoadipate reductase large subunit like protein [Verticillium longisporum]